MSTETIRDFLGWCTLINFGFLILMTLAYCFQRNRIAKLHGLMFGFDVFRYGESRARVGLELYRFIAYYKLAILIFNLVPYLALSIVA